MDAGVTIELPDTVLIDPEVSVGADTRIEPGVQLLGSNILSVSNFRDAAGNVGIELVFTPIENDAADIERAVAAFAGAAPKGGMIVVGDSTTNAHRDLIISLAARHRLPAVYWNNFFVSAGGLMSYGVDWVHEFGQVAYYVDRILRGSKPADLPVQATTKFVTALNVKTAKALGLTVPPGLLVAADEVIE